MTELNQYDHPRMHQCHLLKPNLFCTYFSSTELYTAISLMSAMQVNLAFMFFPVLVSSSNLVLIANHLYYIFGG